MSLTDCGSVKNGPACSDTPLQPPPVQSIYLLLLVPLIGSQRQHTHTQGDFKAANSNSPVPHMHVCGLLGGVKNLKSPYSQEKSIIYTPRIIIL